MRTVCQIPRILSSEQTADPTYGRLSPVMTCNGDFTPVLAKHSKSFPLIDCVSAGVDRMQRSFAPMRKHLEAWQLIIAANPRWQSRAGTSVARCNSS